jgi:hypothetical protein
METAISFKSGKYVHASDCNHQSYLELRLHCPECGEPVYFKRRQIPIDRPFFSHHEKKENAIKCSLRTEGIPIGIASEVVRGIKHGQLVDKFQKEYLSEISNSLGILSDTLIDFIKESQFENLDRDVYLDFLEAIKKNLPYIRILMATPSDFDKEKLDESVHDVCLFLRSPYGNWVGNFIYQTAYFIAVTLRQEYVSQYVANYFFADKRETTIFPLDQSRLKIIKKYAEEILDYEDPRNLCIDKISSAIVNHLIFKWRYPDLLPDLTSDSISKNAKRYSGYARDDLLFPASRLKEGASLKELRFEVQPIKAKSPTIPQVEVNKDMEAFLEYVRQNPINKNPTSFKANSIEHAQMIARAFLRDRGIVATIKIVDGNFIVELPS